MEKVLLLNPSQAASLTPGDARGFSAALVGSEFCQSQAPSAGALENLRRNFRGRVGAATSIMTDSGLAEWNKFLAGPCRRGLISEIVVNDWGFAARAAASRLPLSAGRLLVRELVKLERGWSAAFIKSHGIVSAEADTPELAAQAKERLGLKISFHPSSVFKAVTSYCPFERHFRFGCARGCGGGAVRLRSRELSFPLLLSEKAYFTPMPDRLAPRWVWRAVSSPLPGGSRAGNSYI